MRQQRLHDFISRAEVLVSEARSFSDLGQGVGQKATHPVASVDDYFQALQRAVALWPLLVDLSDDHVLQLLLVHWQKLVLNAWEHDIASKDSRARAGVTFALVWQSIDKKLHCNASKFSPNARL